MWDPREVIGLQRFPPHQWINPSAGGLIKWISGMLNGGIHLEKVDHRGHMCLSWYSPLPLSSILSGRHELSRMTPLLGLYHDAFFTSP